MNKNKMDFELTTDLAKDFTIFKKESGIEIDTKKLIGRGGFSFVFLGKQKNKNYALKVLTLKPETESKDENQKIQQNNNFAKNEMVVSLNLKNKFCVKSYGGYNLKTSKIILLEYAENKDLSLLISHFYKEKLFQLNFNREDNLNSNFMFHMSESFIRFFIIQIINALDYLHKMSFVHRDLKPENLLLSSEFNIKLADFALSSPVPNYGNFTILNVGTNIYMPPESYNETQIDVKYAYKSDYWALGCILHKMITGEHLIESTKSKDIKQEINKKYDQISTDENYIYKISKREGLSQELNKLMKSMLEINLVKRININDIKNCDWLENKKEEIDFIHDVHDNDYKKFLTELQKLDFINKKSKRDTSTQINSEHYNLNPMFVQNPIKQNNKIKKKINIFKAKRT